MENEINVPVVAAGKPWLSYVIIAVVVVVAGGGYAVYGKFFKAPDGQQLLRDAYAKVSHARTYSIDNTIEIKGVVAPASGGLRNTSISPIIFSAKGVLDKTDITHLKASLDISLQADDIMGENYSLTAKLISQTTDFYFEITKFPEAVTKDPQFASSPYAELMNKWIHTPLNTADASSTGAQLLGIGQGINQQNVQQNIADAQKIFDSASLSKVTSMDQAADMSGEKTYHIVFTMDRAGVRQFLTDIVSKEGQKITAEQSILLDTYLQKIDINGEAWVGAVSKTPFKYTVVIAPHIEEIKMPDLTITATNILSDIDKPASIQIPKDVVELKDIMGGGL
jgi:hypothetical protein